MSWIVTAHGVEFDILKPRIEDINIADIAKSLSKICRFNGHTCRFYSVAEHSIHVASQVPPGYQLAALLHDAAEAYIGDMVSPLKREIKQYQKIETELNEAIAEKFGIPSKMPEKVKRADLRALATEKRDLMADAPTPWRWIEGIEPWEERISNDPEGFWANPKNAEKAFLDQFSKLTKMEP